MARSWMERIRRDATQWTQAGSAPANALFFRNHVDGGWFLPTDYASVTQVGNSPAWDILGRDLASANYAASANLCAHARITTLSPNQLFRVEVRIVWPRPGAPVPQGGFCVLEQVDNVTTQTSIYRRVQVASAVRINPVTGM